MRTREVKDGRLLPRRPESTGETPRNWTDQNMFPHGSIDGGRLFVWEPGDMTRYEMAVVDPDVDIGTGAVVVMIKNKAVMFEVNAVLTEQYFMEVFHGLPHLDSLPLRYQYIKALSYVLNLNIDDDDLAAMVQKLQERAYDAFWPQD